MEREELKSIVSEVLSRVLKAEEPVKPKPTVRGNMARWLREESLYDLRAKPMKQKLPEDLTPSCDDKNLVPSPDNKGAICEIVQSTPARIGVWRAGTRYLTRIALKLRADHAVAKDAVYAELPEDFCTKNQYVPLHTQAKSKEEFLLRPDLGRKLDETSMATVQSQGIKNPDIQIIVADGLSSWATGRYAPTLVSELIKLYQGAGLKVGTVFCVRYSRIAIQDVIGEAVGAKVSMIILGERPGLGSGDSLSNYIIYGPKVGAVNADKSMISNIHPAGHKPVDAAKLTFEMTMKMMEQKCSGINLHL